MKKILSKVGTSLTLGYLGLFNAVNAFAASPNPSNGNTLSIDSFNPNKGQINVATDPSTLVKNIITIVFIVAAALTFFYLIFGAIKWITSGGDKSKVEEARNRITAAVIGLLILAATWAIFQLVLQVAFGSTGFTVPSLNS